MSINYRLYQDNRKNSKKKGHWYARTVVTNCVDIKALAARISNSCTVTEPDILAVISALVTEMNYALTQGSKVKVDGLGTSVWESIRMGWRKPTTSMFRRISSVLMCSSFQRQ